MKQSSITLSRIIEWHKGRNGTFRNFGLAENQIITTPRAIELCDEFNISMLTKKYKDKVEELLIKTSCKLIIIPEEMLTPSCFTDGKTFLFHPNPKDLLIDFCKYFLDFGAPNKKENIHPTAIIEQGAKIGANSHIQANVYISKNSEIGSNCTIGQNTVIKNTTVKNNVSIGANNTIGENGFGYSKRENGEVELFPHFGRVIIEGNVHMGNNNCIDRGSLSDTVIKQNVKMDNLIHIAHNVVIGKNSLIIACSMIAGSVAIGENCWVAPSSTIRNALKIGKNATIGLGSTVTKDVEDNQIVIGSPAIPSNDFAILRKIQKEILLTHKTENNKK